jgi:hypothetical protein
MPTYITGNKYKAEFGEVEETVSLIRSPHVPVHVQATYR